jgi:hypothetical protein
VNDPRLDRLTEFDERSRGFRAVAGLEDRPARSYTWRCDIWLDQGREGACVGFAVTAEAAARPVIVTGLTDRDALAVYRRARELDQWPGEDYSGTSVLAGIKAGVELGWFREYRWAFGEPDLRLAVGYRGPAILGVNWYEGMRQPDDVGFVHLAGAVIGGHAILCLGYSKKRDAYRLHNSWGQDWGQIGECWITRDDLARLLAEEGEACIPETRYRPKP